MEIVGGFSPAQVEARHPCLPQKRRSLYFGYILMPLNLGCCARHRGEGSGPGAVTSARPGTSNLTSGQHLCPGCNIGQLRVSLGVAILRPLSAPRGGFPAASICSSGWFSCSLYLHLRVVFLQPLSAARGGFPAASISICSSKKHKALLVK